MEQDKFLSAAGKTAPCLHAGDCGLAVSSSKGKDKMALIGEEICSTTQAFNLPRRIGSQSGHVWNRASHLKMLS